MAAIPALLVFLILHGVFFGDVIVGGKSLSASTYTAGLTPHGPRDAPATPGVPHLLDVEGAAWVDEPSPRLASAAFAAGELPLWNPATGLGAPLAANLNSGAGNPFQLALNLLPTPLAADLFYLARLMLLAVFVWAFLRELSLGSLAAFTGAASVAYGGYAMAWIVHHPLSSELFLPLGLLGLERGRRGRPGGWILLAFAAAASLLGGKLQASLLCFAFVGVYALRRSAPGEGGAGPVTVAAVVSGLVLGCAVAAWLLVPAGELMTRASGLTLGGRSQLASFTVPWPSLASLALPRLFTAAGDAFARDLLLTPAVGIVVVVLAAVGVVASAAPLVAVARLSVLWAATLLLRNAGAFGDVATGLPAVRGILFVKYTFTAVFALAVAAAIGLDAIVGDRVARGRALRAAGVTVLALAGLAAAAVWSHDLATHPRALLGSAGVAAALILAVALWHGERLGGRALGIVLAVLVLSELRWFAPSQHPPRVDPYRAPAYVEFLRGAPPGRVIADPDLMVPLTSAAAGLRDLRAIDVLTPGSYYAFFMRLVSFCDRVIHFTVDPDLALAATAPALDLAGVRWVATRHPLALDDLATRVRSQVGRERTARLLAGMTRLRTEGAPLVIGPIALGDDERFAFTLATPFELEVAGTSDAAELAWGALVRGTGAGVHLRVRVDGVPSDAAEEPLVLPAVERWQEQHLALGQAGAPRHVRLRVRGESADGTPVRVSLGNLGFGPGATAEVRLAEERTARHRQEAPGLRRVFEDAEFGVTVYENTNALPRAFRVAHVEPSDGEEAALTRLGDGFDFRSAALVARAEVAAVSAALAGVPSGAAAAGETSVRAETPGVVTIATSGDAPAVLVLGDLAYPGWRATLDGRDVPLLTVDGVLRGVVVPAGAHLVVFRYRPGSLGLGLTISVLGLVALVPYRRWSARAHDRDGTM